MMDVLPEDVPIEQIVRIDPDCKYIVVLPAGTPEDRIAAYAEAMNDWWNDEASQFCITGEGATVYRLEKS